MSERTYYDTTSGEITYMMDCERPESVQLGDLPWNWVEGLYPRDTHYIDLTDPENPVPTERPAQATTLTGLVLTDLPVPCTVYINNEAFPHDEPSLELDFPLPGTYTVRVEAFPYLDWSATIPVP